MRGETRPIRKVVRWGWYPAQDFSILFLDPCPQELFGIRIRRGEIRHEDEPEDDVGGFVLPEETGEEGLEDWERFPDRTANYNEPGLSIRHGG